MCHVQTLLPFECGWRCLLLGFKLLCMVLSITTADRATGTGVNCSIAVWFHMLIWYTLTTLEAKDCKYVYSVQLCTHTSQTQSCTKALMVLLFQDGLLSHNAHASQQVASLSVINWLSIALYNLDESQGCGRIFTVTSKLQSTFSVILNYSNFTNHRVPILLQIVNWTYFKLNTSWST